MEPLSSTSTRENLAITLPNHKDWSSLPGDIISCFASRIYSFKDLCAFGGVCKLWRSESIDTKSNNTALRSHHRVPVLLLKEIKAPIRYIYSLTNGQNSQLDLPETEGKYCYSSLGWLLLTTTCKKENNDQILELFNPLTRARIKLPLLRRKVFKLRSLKKFVLSTSPSIISDYEILLISNEHLVYYKTGYNNSRWIRVRIPSLYPLLMKLMMDAVYLKGQFYVLDFLARIFICEINDRNKPRVTLKLVVPHDPSPIFGDSRVYVAHYLVEFAGTLLLVQYSDNSDHVTKDYKVRKVPIDTGKCKSWENSQVVETLGNKTVFVGESNSSFWIEPLDDSICRVNCVYFAHRDETGETEVGIYHMNDGKTERLPEQSPCFKLLKSHSWLQPSF